MKEYKAWKANGFLALLLVLAGLAGSIALLTLERFAIAVPLAILTLLLSTGLVIVQPNQSAVVTFFGRYAGTIRESGIWLTIPLSSRKKVSLRVRNFNSAKLKVNDVNGNPIEIAAVIVFRVVDAAKAVFDVDNYEEFVEIQSESALRHVASKYPYDHFEGEGLSLRGNSDEISTELAAELQERLSIAGVEMKEAKLTHLAYSTEIASAMLQRQQAAAILAARKIIVEGAVGMVEMAIARLEAEGIVKLDEERKAAMINNLMVAIVSDKAASPVINTGSLY
jgi:regulator of protease activity HflC (stomatin/prohibitin superfamily)